MPLTILRTKDGVLDAADAAALDALGTRLAAGNGKLLLHLHGGLVTQSAAEDVARRLSAAGPQSFNAPPDWEQVYVVWRTGVLETLQANWRDLASNDQIYNAILKRVIKVVGDRIGIQGPGAARGLKALSIADINAQLDGSTDTPFEHFDAQAEEVRLASRAIPIASSEDDIANDLELELLDDGDLQLAAEDIAAQLESSQGAASRGVQAGDAGAGAALLERLDRARVQELETVSPPATARAIFSPAVLAMLVRHGVAIGLAVIRRFRSGHDHGLYATIVEEVVRRLYGDLIGGAIWGMMKGDAADHFLAGRLGDHLLTMLASHNLDRVVVSAHSAGSIWASEMLIAAAQRGLNVQFDCAFLAPAVRTKRFAEALGQAGGLIGRFRLYAMSDELERADVLLGEGRGFIYPSSLLYCVSGLFEDNRHVPLPDAPILGMQRFIGANSPWDQDPVEGAALATVRAFLAQHDRQVFAISSAGAGLNCSSKSHGGFDDDAETLASVATFLD